VAASLTSFLIDGGFDGLGHRNFRCKISKGNPSKFLKRVITLLAHKFFNAIQKGFPQFEPVPHGRCADLNRRRPCHYIFNNTSLIGDAPYTRDGQMGNTADLRYRGESERFDDGT